MVMTPLRLSKQGERSVNVTNSSPSQDYSHPDDETIYRLNEYIENRESELLLI